MESRSTSGKAEDQRKTDMLRYTSRNINSSTQMGRKETNNLHGCIRRSQIFVRSKSKSSSKM